MQNKYSSDERAIIWLDMFDLVTKKQEEILAFFDRPSDIFTKFSQSFDKLKIVLSKENFDKMAYALDEQYLQRHITELDSQNIKVITYFSEDYPKQFLNFDDKPIILYCKGDLSLMKTKCVGIVGTRKPSMYGRTVTEKFSKALASSGITIVSGLASGI